MSTVAEFQEALRATGGYETPPSACRVAPSRPGLATSWRFYWTGLLRHCVLPGARAARRGMFDDAAWAHFSFAPIREAEALGAVCTCEGFQSLLSGGPFVYAANHMSLLETIVLPAALLAFSPLAVVVKRSLLSYPVFGGPLRAVRPIAVSRRDARRDLLTVLEEGSARLASGQSVLLFPQATRTAVFDPQRFNSLGAKLARRAGRPLVPVALRTDFAAAGRFLRDIGPIDPGRPIRFAAGAPLPPTGHGRSLHAACLAFLHQRLRSWGLPVAPLPAAETPGEGS